ncbi:MAG: type II toxin-antitoxin system RelE/ParE family toxin [Chloroflexi bacterium]|nr:type II toxin-antitoxin system RelE/ParE family toxin [Chloroflexota bacterium]
MHEVEFYVLANGRVPVEEYFAKMQLADFKKMSARIERAAESGIPTNPEHAKEFVFRERGAQWRLREFKTLHDRVFWCPLPGGTEIVLTHAFPKRGQATPVAEKRTAADRMDLLRAEFSEGMDHEL